MWPPTAKLLKKYYICECIITKRVPSKMTTARYSHPWITTDIRRPIRRKQRAHTKAGNTKIKRDIDRYNRLQRDKANPKRFWSFIKSRGQDASGVPTLKNKDGFLKSDTSSKANILNDQFKSVFCELKFLQHARQRR